MSFLRKKYKVRRVTLEGGHQVSLPPAWMEGKNIEEVEVLYNSDIIVIIPPGIKVTENNEKHLEGDYERERRND